MCSALYAHVAQISTQTLQYVVSHQRTKLFLDGIGMFFLKMWSVKIKTWKSIANAYIAFIVLKAKYAFAPTEEVRICCASL